MHAVQTHLVGDFNVNADLLLLGRADILADILAGLGAVPAIIAFTATLALGDDDGSTLGSCAHSQNNERVSEAKNECSARQSARRS